jgi:mannan endo-1,4-beta-mannosidase
MQAKFLIDAIMGVDANGNETLLYNFEGTGEFELQINWAPAAGLQLSDGWSASGNRSLAGYTTIEDGQEVILQTYPSGGILLADGVTSLSLTANVADATDGVTAKLWAKDQDGAWRDAGAVPVTNGGIDLSLDISDLNELQGFGVQFQGLTNEHSKFYIDDLVFN